MHRSFRTRVLVSAIAVAGCAGSFAAMSDGASASATGSPATTVVTAPGPAADAAAGPSSTLPPLPVPVAAPADNEPEPQQYYGRIVIPEIDVDSPLLEGIRLGTLDHGPGHWPGTAMPGELGNVVVAGHRTSHNADFRRLDELEPGDQIIFDLDDSEGIPTATVAPDDPYSGVYVYEVTAVFRVSPDDGMWVVTQDYRHEMTLFACHPPGSVSERIVVQADLVAVDDVPAPVPPDPPRQRPTATTLLENTGD